MIFLADTQLLLWAATNPGRLPEDTLELFQNAAHEPCFSAASIWEIAIKSGLGRADFTVDAARFRGALLTQGFAELAITGAHAALVSGLPQIHKDPFDRLLVAQANHEGILLLTADRIVARYAGQIQLVAR